MYGANTNPFAIANSRFASCQYIYIYICMYIYTMFVIPFAIATSRFAGGPMHELLKCSKPINQSGRQAGKISGRQENCVAPKA